MSKFSLLSSSARQFLGLAASADEDAAPPPATPAPAPADPPADPAPEDPPANPATPAPAPAPAPQPDASAGAEPITLAAAREATDAAREQGFAAANTRMKEVFASAEGQANMSMAAFLLTTSAASAADVIAHLKSAPGAAAAPVAAIPNTDIDLGSGTDPTALTEDGAGGDAKTVEDGWKAAKDKTAAALGVGGVAVPAAHAAAAAGTTTVNYQPTGN